MSSPSLKELKSLTDEELILEYDSRALGTVVGTKFYLDEIRARETSKVTEKVARLTMVMTVLTVVITIATVVNVAVFLNDSPTVPGFIR